jgi:hypothetical protein
MIQAIKAQLTKPALLPVRPGRGWWIRPRH